MRIDDLIERVRGLTGPDREADADIYIAFHIPAERVGRIDRLGGCVGWWPKDAPYESAVDVPFYTASLDAAVALVERVLPGWWWKAGTCCVSDDACIAPDFNSPIHGERLKKQFFPLVAGSEFDAGFDVDRRPPGNVPIALIEALLLALAAIPHSKEGGK